MDLCERLDCSGSESWSNDGYVLVQHMIKYHFDMVVSFRMRFTLRELSVQSKTLQAAGLEALMHKYTLGNMPAIIACSHATESHAVQMMVLRLCHRDVQTSTDETSLLGFHDCIYQTCALVR